ncbi:molybdate ABC transporter substrate-binding protein [Cognatishimia activa]|uniref:molybdate ABC transporter substrate-binding protein n=1 Tax=Cognatishimia activa TaxID=1715691 RepID=UPI0022302EA3|nr:molybdate ABC transporter substrate-binding protein [Cognatishimia activa]UZD91541.1 molybdate ABC transporter substrate-binding protein [Cognatishimia activa]
MRVIALFCLIFFALPARAEVTVFAAASLRGALDEVNAEFEGDVIVSYASSAALARQIAQGAPADVYLSANPDWVQYLVDDDFVDVQKNGPILGNQLVLIGSSQSLDTTLDTLPSVLEGRNLATGLTSAVPAGIYARQALQSAGLWQGVEPHLVETDNVRAALTLVSLAEVDYALVYTTDALTAVNVRVLDHVSTSTHSPIRYAGAVLSKHQEAVNYFDFLTTEPALEIFKAHGFLTLEGAS